MTTATVCGSAGERREQESPPKSQHGKDLSVDKGGNIMISYLYDFWKSSETPATSGKIQREKKEGCTSNQENKT